MVASRAAGSKRGGGAPWNDHFEAPINTRGRYKQLTYSSS